MSIVCILSISFSSHTFDRSKRAKRHARPCRDEPDKSSCSLLGFAGYTSYFRCLTHPEPVIAQKHCHRSFNFNGKLSSIKIGSFWGLTSGQTRSIDYLMIPRCDHSFCSPFPMNLISRFLKIYGKLGKWASMIKPFRKGSNTIRNCGTNKTPATSTTWYLMRKLMR